MALLQGLGEQYHCWALLKKKNQRNRKTWPNIACVYKIKCRSANGKLLFIRTFERRMCVAWCFTFPSARLYASCMPKSEATMHSLRCTWSFNDGNGGGGGEYWHFMIRGVAFECRRTSITVCTDEKLVNGCYTASVIYEMLLFLFYFVFAFALISDACTKWHYELIPLDQKQTFALVCSTKIWMYTPKSGTHMTSAKQSALK